MAADGMDGCDGMDMEQPSLCHAHAFAQQQSLDQHELPPVPAFIPTILTLIFQDVALARLAPGAEPSEPVLAHATAPPLAIRNCCFRI